MADEASIRKGRTGPPVPVSGGELDFLADLAGRLTGILQEVAGS
jgi:hypothetical protein